MTKHEWVLLVDYQEYENDHYHDQVLKGFFCI